MNLEALNMIINDREELLVAQAHSVGTKNVDATLGVARLLLSNKGDLRALSKAQMYHYDQCIKPLLERVPCEGAIGYLDDGESSCFGCGFIDDETLALCYIDDDFMCQICRHDAEKLSAK